MSRKVALAVAVGLFLLQCFVTFWVVSVFLSDRTANVKGRSGLHQKQNRTDKAEAKAMLLKPILTTMSCRAYRPTVKVVGNLGTKHIMSLPG
jgi:hypothetical protein